MEWSKLPQETWENKEFINKVCLESMTVMAHWDTASFFDPVTTLVACLIMEVFFAMQGGIF